MLNNYEKWNELNYWLVTVWTAKETKKRQRERKEEFYNYSSLINVTFRILKHFRCLDNHHHHHQYHHIYLVYECRMCAGERHFRYTVRWPFEYSAADKLQPFRPKPNCQIVGTIDHRFGIDHIDHLWIVSTFNSNFRLSESCGKKPAFHKPKTQNRNADNFEKAFYRNEIILIYFVWMKLLYSNVFIDVILSIYNKIWNRAPPTRRYSRLTARDIINETFLFTPPTT